MKTHKNPALRKTAVVSADAKKTPPPISPKPGRKVEAKPPKLELVDNKWIVVSIYSSSLANLDEENLGPTEKASQVICRKCIIV